MKREIKFRAWYNGEMYNYVEHTTFHDGSWSCTGLHKEGERSFSPDIHKVQLMQFTGLKDKNGVEIWEGDIVGNKYGIYTVEYVIKNYEPGFFLIQPDEIFESEFDNTVVIGNIFENSELLQP